MVCPPHPISLASDAIRTETPAVGGHMEPSNSRRGNPCQKDNLFVALSCGKERSGRHLKCLLAIGGDLKLALRKVHIES